MQRSRKSMRVLGMFVCAFVLIQGLSVADADSYPQPWETMTLYGTGDGTGPGTDYTFSYGLIEDPTAPGSDFYYSSGTNTFLGGLTEYVTGATLSLGGDSLLEIEEVLRTPPASGAQRTMASATYNERGQITELVQENKDGVSSDDTMVFGYDALGRLTSATLAADLEDPIVLYEWDFDYDERGNLVDDVWNWRNDPTRFCETNVGYDAEALLTRLTAHDHLDPSPSNWWGYTATYGYDADGRITAMADGRDDDCDGTIDIYTRNTQYSYDDYGNLTRMYDSVHDEDVVYWSRNPSNEIITVVSTPGETPVVGQVNYDGNGHFVGMDVDGSPFLTVASVDGDGLPIQIRNWQWGGPLAPGLASADLVRTVLNTDLGDPLNSDRVTMVFPNAAGGLAGTMSAGELSLCAYPDLGAGATVKRPKGVTIGADGSVTPEAHLYYQHPDGSVPIMIVVNGRGDTVVGVSYLTPEYHPYPSFNFFEAWPSGSGGGMPIYSETVDGTPYIMGSITPAGEYKMFQYDEGGEMEAIVQMNEVDVAGVGSIPTVSEWGMVVMALVMLSAGTLIFLRHRAELS